MIELFRPTTAVVLRRRSRYSCISSIDSELLDREDGTTDTAFAAVLIQGRRVQPGRNSSSRSALNWIFFCRTWLAEYRGDSPLYSAGHN